MKPISWTPEKNDWLKKERGVCFEDVLFCMDNDQVVAIEEHPNQKKYPGQKMMIIRISNYIYLVPYVETETEVVFKTIIPSRKATKKHGGEQ